MSTSFIHTSAALFCGVLLACSAAPIGAGETAGKVQALASVHAGLAVVLDGEEETLIPELARTERFLVHGLAATPEKAEALRRALFEAGFAGQAGVESLKLQPLPYAENSVNLLIAADGTAALKRGLTFTEILRVLTPKGAACLGVSSKEKEALTKVLAEAGIKDFRFVEEGRLWLVFRKPRPAGMDDWSHWNHGPEGGFVSRDQLLERPNQIQWITGPLWGSPRLAGVPGANNPSGFRSANGRNFYMQGGLVARDAFNGVMLWHMPAPKGFEGRLLIASGDEVYLYRDGEIAALDAATGKDLRVYGKVDKCSNLLLVDGLLLSFEPKRLCAYEAASGKVRWESAEGAGAGAPVASAGKVCFGKNGIVCLDLADGKVSWKKEDAGLGGILFAFGERLLLRSGKENPVLTALNLKDGSTAWTHQTNEKKPGEVFFASNLIWIQHPDDRAARSTDGFHNPKGGVAFRWEGLDPATGETRRTLPEPVTLQFKCHRLFATDRFLIDNRPIYFTSWEDGSVTRFEATRLACGSTCGLGQGLFFGLYANSNQCMCLRPAISGITAFASDRKTIDGAVKVEEEGRWVLGVAEASPVAEKSGSSGWPMYRYDGLRSACAPVPVQGGLTVLWRKALLPGPAWPERDAPGALLRNDWKLNKVSGDPITQATLTSDLALVALTHAQQLVALERTTGDIRWRVSLPARMDAPPACYQGLCLAACHDGWVYAFRAADGKEAWRFRAAPAERRMVAYGEVESTWPVVGGVLLEDDSAYVVAGRTTEADGGLYVHALDAKSGKVRWSGRCVKPDDGPIGAWNLRGLRDAYFGPADFLVCDGKGVAVAGHSHGFFDCKTGKESGKRSFDGRHIGWMQSRYSSDNQKLDYPPMARMGGQSVTARSGTLTMSGKPGWKAAFPKSWSVEALAGGGNPAGGKPASAPVCPAVRAPVTAQAPVIDGKLDPCYAASAQPLTFSLLNGGKGKPKEGTAAWVLSDEQNLYLAFRCEKADPEQVVCKKAERDGDVWQDECIEIFLDPRGTRAKPYCHIIINAAGVTQEAKGEDVSWNPNLEVKCGKEPGAAWIAEVRIPLAEIAGSEKVANGWSLNLNRSARQPDNPQACEDTAWSPTYGTSSHVPTMFGYLWLDGIPGGKDDAAYAAWLKQTGHGTAPAQKEEDEAPRGGEAATVVAALACEPGKSQGELWVLSVRDGSRLATVPLPAAPAFEGLSLADGQVYVALQDGSVVCLGKK